METNSGYMDPFTGGSRYVPNSSTSTQADVTPKPPANSSAGESNPNVNKLLNEHLPCYKYITFDQSNPSMILEKLKNFNKNPGDGNHHISDEMLENVVKLGDNAANPDVQTVETLKQLLDWPKELRFPVLDVTRLVVRSSSIFQLLLPTHSHHWTELISCIQNDNGVPANKIMSLRVISNCMIHEEGRSVMTGAGVLTSALSQISQIHEGPAALQVAITTFLLNISVYNNASFIKELAEDLYIATAGAMIWIVETEAMSRLLLSLGNQALNKNNIDVLEEIRKNKHLKEKCTSLATGQGYKVEKITNCAKKIITVVW